MTPKWQKIKETTSKIWANLLMLLVFTTINLIGLLGFAATIYFFLLGYFSSYEKEWLFAFLLYLLCLISANLFIVKINLDSRKSQARKNFNLNTIKYILEKKENVTQRDNIELIELMEHYFKAELDQDISDIRLNSKNNKTLLRRFYQPR